MEPLAIVEAFHERKDLPTRLIPGVIHLVMNELILQGTEEALRHGVVVAVAFPAHTRRDAEGAELALIRDAALLRTVIRVMN